MKHIFLLANAVKELVFDRGYGYGTYVDYYGKFNYDIRMLKGDPAARLQYGSFSNIDLRSRSSTFKVTTTDNCVIIDSNKVHISARRVA